jgi:hypothetical protein
MSDIDFEDEARASRARQAADPDQEVGGIAVDRLRSIIERIERLEESARRSPTTSRTSLPRPSPPAST